MDMGSQVAHGDVIAMLGAGRRNTMSGPVGTAGIVLVGLFIAVASAYLLVNPGGLPSIFYLPYLVRFVPLVFLGAVALAWPLLVLLFALLAMFGGELVDSVVRPLLPISPFWALLALTVGAQIARNVHRDRAVPWGEMTALLLLLAWAALYELEQPSLTLHGIVLPLLAGIGLITALGLVNTWRQVGFAVVSLYLAFLLLELQLLPFLIPSWGTFGGVLREQFGGLDSALRQATSLDWLFNAIALLSLGMAVRLGGKTRILMLALFLLFAASSVLTFSRGAYLGLGAGMVALLMVERRGSRHELQWMVVAAIAVGAVAYYSGAYAFSFEFRGLDRELRFLEEGYLGRLTIIVEGLLALPKHWLVGAGIDVRNARHSSLIGPAIIYGGVYAIALWAFILVLFRRSYRMAKTSRISDAGTWGKAISLGLYCSFAGAIAQSLLDPTLFSLSFTTVFWIMRGLETGIWRSGLTMNTNGQGNARIPDPAVSQQQPLSPI